MDLSIKILFNVSIYKAIFQQLRLTESLWVHFLVADHLYLLRHHNEKEGEVCVCLNLMNLMTSSLHSVFDQRERREGKKKGEARCSLEFKFCTVNGNCYFHCSGIGTFMFHNGHLTITQYLKLIVINIL